jgi:DNA repair exonuclease SbcCD ATPase subunit
MRNLDFKYIFACNFLPFGPEGFELFLKNYGNIVLIQGENRDAKSLELNESTSETRISSNGSGKSSIQEIIVWTLYGKTVKRPEKIGIDDVVHNKTKKDCKTIVEFDKYRVMRTRSGKKTTLRLWESDQGVWDDSTEITQGTVAQTSKRIEELIGLTYESFVNICIFTDDQRSCFLECANDTKTEIIENLMQLTCYRDWFEQAKNLKKEIKLNFEMKTKEYTLLLSNKDDAVRRLDLTQKNRTNWVALKVQEQANLRSKIATKTSELGQTDTGRALLAYQEAQQKIVDINAELAKLGTVRADLEKKFALIREKDAVIKEDAQKVKDTFQSISNELATHRSSRKAIEEEIEELKGETPGNRCGKCKSIIQAENIDSYIEQQLRKISDIDLDINKCILSSKEIAAKVEEIKANQAKIKQIEAAAEQKRKATDNSIQALQSELTIASQVREPKADSAEFLLQQQIEELNKQLEDKKKEAAGKSPYDEILDNDKKELSNITLLVEQKEKEVNKLESSIVYYDYWIYAFGPTGIRKWVIDGIIPDLNKNVNYWLGPLIDNSVTLNFSNTLVEKIERNPPDGDPYIYYAMSTGQRRRLNLAVGHSFAYITSLSAESIPSLIFLDEVTTNVDPLGVQGIYNMIRELATDKQVFITTHDPDLVQMLQGASIIRLVHENGFTKKV